MMTALKRITQLLTVILLCTAGNAVDAQRKAPEGRKPARTVTIPVTVRLKESRAQRELQTIEVLQVLEDDVPQEILAKRGGTIVPLTLAILIQDDVVSSIANEISGLAAFVRRLPPNSRVLVGYLRSGSLQVRQRFTPDLERAARALRIPISSPTSAPYNPYVQTIEALKRFESQPTGSRRAVLLVSDGLDVSRGVSGSSPSQSLDLQRAINEAQRRGVAVYSFFAPTTGGTQGGSSVLASYGQGSLQRLSDETGGRAFFQGTLAPVSFDPYLRDLSPLLARQFALTYLSTNTDKGFHRIKIISDLADGEILHPSGYVR
ncbi:MAG TPA: hypothetical protein VM866_08840 [Pyrinomonadaceae bacterium]|nr:hypothetical protein [Pyrinomonadaceae bacterium]